MRNHHQRPRLHLRWLEKRGLAMPPRPENINPGSVETQLTWQESRQLLDACMDDRMD